MVDGPRARPAVSALRARGALDALQGATARPAPVRGMPCGRWSSPCRPARTWAPPTSTPPLDRVTLAPRQPDPAWTQKVPPGPDGRQRHLSAVWDMALEARGVQGILRISFPCPIVVMGGSNLPEGQELVGMFAYRLVSGHWQVQTGVARIGEEGTVTTAGVLGLNVAMGWEKRRPEWVDVAWLAMRVHMGRQRKGGVDVIDVEGGDNAPPPSARKRKGRARPPESPAYGHPGGAGGAGGRAGAEGGGARVGGAAAAAAAGGGVGGDAMSAEAANRDLEAHLSRANEDRRAAESRLADVTKERDCLVTRVKTLERDLGTARKAPPAPAKPPAQTGEGAEGAKGPPGERAGGGGGNAAGVRYLLAGAQAWHARAEACAGQMSAVSTGLRMAMLASGQHVEVDTVAPHMARVSAAHEDVRRQYPPHRLTSAAMDPSFAEAGVEQSSQGSASRSSAPGGGGGRSSPFDFGTT